MCACARARVCVCVFGFLALLVNLCEIFSYARLAIVSAMERISIVLPNLLNALI